MDMDASSPSMAILERSQAAVIQSALRRPYGRLFLTLELLAFCMALAFALRDAVEDGPWPVDWGIYWYAIFYGLRCGDWLVIALTGLDNHCVKIARQVVNIVALAMMFAWAEEIVRIRHRTRGQSQSSSWWCLGGLIGFHAVSAFCLGAFLFTSEEMEMVANLESGGAQFLEGSDTYEILPGGDADGMLPDIFIDVKQQADSSKAPTRTKSSPPCAAKLTPAKQPVAQRAMSSADAAEASPGLISPRFSGIFRTPSPRSSLPARSRMGSTTGSVNSIASASRSRLGSTQSAGRRASIS